MKKKYRKEAELAKEQNKIAKGSTFVGDIESEGSFRIEGTLKGSLKTPGKVVLGESGYIDGDIQCTEADFEGEFKGNLTVGNTLNLRATAVIEGEVVTGKLAVEPDAVLNGTCTMNNGVKNLNKSDERKKSKQSEQQPA